jgi:hypothetical protein
MVRETDILQMTHGTKEQKAEWRRLWKKRHPEKRKL